jgi:hypothetical protein
MNATSKPKRAPCWEHAALVGTGRNGMASHLPSKFELTSGALYLDEVMPPNFLRIRLPHAVCPPAGERSRGGAH